MRRHLSARARLHERRGEWQQAIDVYKTALGEDGRAEPEIHFRLGHAYFRLDENAEAVRWIEAAIVSRPGIPEWHYRLGFIHEREGDYRAAISSYGKALDLAPQHDSWKKRLEGCQSRLKHLDAKKQKEALAAHNRELTEARQLRDRELENQHRLQEQRLEQSRRLREEQVQEARRLREQRIEDARRLREVRKEKIRRRQEERLQAVYVTVGNLQKQSLFHQSIDMLLAQVKDNPESVELLKRLGDAYDTVQEYKTAAGYFEEAAHKAQAAELAFAAGYSYARADLAVKANELYELAQRLEGNELLTLGTGVFFQRRGLWKEAAKHFKEQLELVPTSPELHFRLGMSYDRLYEWDSAKNHYREALALQPNRPYLYYRLGFVCERLGNYDEAVDAYAVAAAYKNKSSTLWAYRLGYCLTHLERYEEACLAYLSSEPALWKKYRVSDDLAVPGYGPRGNPHLKSRLSSVAAEGRAEEAQAIGTLAMQMGDHQTAADAFSMLVDSAPTNATDNYLRLGYAEYLVGNFERAASTLTQMRVHRAPHGIDTSAFNKDKSLVEVMTYTELSESLPLRDDLVMYESSHGDSVSCNPYAIFEEISRSGGSDQWHVWVCNDINRAPVSVRNHPRVILVAKGSHLYLRYLATAKYLINNTSFPPYFIRRDGQKYLNTWHGTPLKTLGGDVKTGFFEHRNITRNLLQVTHLIVPNVHTRDALIDSHEISGLFTGKVALTGYPRIDRTLDPSQERVQGLRGQLGIQSDDDRPVVLYAPTWRGGLGSSHFDTDQLERDIAALQDTGRHVFFRAHRFAESVIRESGTAARVVPADIDTNDLLSAVDVLVTDYSSIFFDYLPLKRPVVFYTPDLEDYESYRGLYFKMADMPGKCCSNTAELSSAVHEAITGSTGSDMALAIREFCPMEDGRAAARTADFFFKDDEEFVLRSDQENKTSIVFRQSFIPNGITSSFISMVSEIDPEKYRLILLFDANSVEKDPERLRLFDTLPPHVQRIPRSGRQSFNAEEKWIDNKFNAQGEVQSEEQMEIVAKSSRREFRRIFGTSEFDHICEFDGYSRFWAAIFAFGGNISGNRVIYLHNELAAEHRMKHPLLAGVFSLFAFYDRLVSVSESVMEANREDLSEDWGIPPEKFVYANNFISPRHIRASARRPAPDGFVEWVGEDRLIASVGRLSPEKGQERLIRSFASALGGLPSTKLAIVGEGNLRPHLEQLIQELGLRGQVMLMGMLDNPFPVIAKADGFILPSLHEGQGLALLEAMVLGKPVVATDIPGPRSLLRGGSGLLVENTPQGICEGLSELSQGTVQVTEFDERIYLRDATEAFVSNFPEA